MYREVKLLSMLQHENVLEFLKSIYTKISHVTADNQIERYFHIPIGGYVGISSLINFFSELTHLSYIITDQLAVDLGTLLAARKLEGQYIQYFMYQVMVSGS